MPDPFGIVKDPTPEAVAIPKLAADAAQKRAVPLMLASNTDPEKPAELAPVGNKVYDETPNIPRSRTPDPMDVVSRPSKYYGIPTDIAKIMDAADSRNASYTKRILGTDLPKYTFQLGAGATEAASLGLVEPGIEPETTGEALFRGAGQLFGSSFVPLGPAVKLGAKFKLSKTAVGAAAAVAAAEIQTRGEASKGRLILDATFGAIFGKLYNTEAHWLKFGGQEPKPGALERLAVKGRLLKPANIAEDSSGASLPSWHEFSGDWDRYRGAEGTQTPIPASKSSGQLLLPDFSSGRVPATRSDFIAGEPIRPGPTEFPYVTESLSGERVMPRYNPPGSNRLNVDVLGGSPLRIEGEGLFKDLGIKRKGRTFIRQQGDAAQRTLNKLGLHSDPDVRETATAVKHFINNTDSINPDDFVGDMKFVRRGQPSNYAVDMELGEFDAAPRARLKTGITKGFAGSNWQRPDRVFMDVERDTGGRIKGFTELFQPGDAAKQTAAMQTNKVGLAVKEAIGKSPGDKQYGFMDYLQANDHNGRAIARHQFGLDDSDIESLNKATNHLKELWNRNFDTPFEEFMTDTLPRMRSASPTDREVLKFSTVANEMDKFAANHEFSINERRFDRFSAGLIRSLSMKEHLDPFMKKVSAIVNDHTYPPTYRDFVADWGRGLRGTDNAFAEKWTPRYQQFLRRLGVNAESADIRDVIDNYIQLTHAGLVGFRAAPVFKNMFNGWQTGAARIGPTWFWKGVMKSMTPEGWERGRLAGMVDEAAHEAAAVRELGAPGPVTKAIRTIASRGLKFYGTIDDYNRQHIFNGMYERVLSAGRNLSKTGEDDVKFLTKAGLYRYHEVIQNEVLNAWKQKGIAEAATIGGVHAAQETQWVYRTQFRPTVMNGEKARALGQFGIWSMNYMEYMRQMMYSGAIKNMPFVERAKWFRDWALTNGSILALMGGAGASLGIGKAVMENAKGWTFLGPLNYGGGPIVDFGKALPQMLQDIQSGVLEGNADKVIKGEAWKRIKSNLASAIPGSGLARDIARAKGPAEQAMSSQFPGSMIFPPLESSNVEPAQSSQEELFRIMTGVGVKK
jgi:hypothetical protein